MIVWPATLTEATVTELRQLEQRAETARADRNPILQARGHSLASSLRWLASELAGLDGLLLDEELDREVADGGA